MAKLGDTVADAFLRKLSPGVASGAGLQPVETFGSDPGALRMWLHTPAGLGAGAALVVVLHGCGQTAQGYAHGAGWLALADRYGFAVLAPEQVRANNMNLCFNWFEPQDVARGSGEAASIAQMVQHAITDHALDPRRVFVTGLSAGGAMTVALLAAYPDVFAAGAVIAGLPYGAASTVQDAFAVMRGQSRLDAKALGDRVRAAAPPGAPPPRISIWQGDADTTVAPAAADALVQQWTDVHGLAASETVATDAPRHHRRVWRGADGEVGVELNVVSGMGHGAPLATGGEAGCGQTGPWLLEVGVSSSLQIAGGWGLTNAASTLGLDSAAAPGDATPSAKSGDAAPPTTRGAASPAKGGDLAETIARALRTAGLLR